MACVLIIKRKFFQEAEEREIREYTKKWYTSFAIWNVDIKIFEYFYNLTWILLATVHMHHVTIDTFHSSLRNPLYPLQLIISGTARSKLWTISQCCMFPSSGSSTSSSLGRQGNVSKNMRRPKKLPLSAYCDLKLEIDRTFPKPY